MNRSLVPVVAALLLVGVVALPAVAEADSGQPAEGSVNNKPASIDDWSASSGTSGGRAETGDLEVLSGSLFDQNGEHDIATIKIELIAQSPVDLEAKTSLGDEIPADKPSEASNGWKVWSGEAGDGLLYFEYQHVYSDDDGTYHWRVFVQDDDDYEDSAWRKGAQDIVIKVGKKVAPYDAPFSNATAKQAAGTAWGLWNADPGASNVSAINFIRMDNTGASPHQSFAIDFNQATFANDGETIDIDGNLEFATVEVSTETAEGNDFTLDISSFTNWAPDSSGGVEVTFSGLDNTVYVAYRLVELPNVLADGQYTASYTIAVA